MRRNADELPIGPIEHVIVLERRKHGRGRLRDRGAVLGTDFIKDIIVFKAQDNIAPNRVGGWWVIRRSTHERVFSVASVGEARHRVCGLGLSGGNGGERNIRQWLRHGRKLDVHMHIEVFAL